VQHSRHVHCFLDVAGNQPWAEFAAALVQYSPQDAEAACIAHRLDVAGNQSLAECAAAFVQHSPQETFAENASLPGLS